MSEDAKTLANGEGDDAALNDEEEISKIKATITMDKRLDLAGLVFVVLYGIGMLIAARDIRAGSTPDPITSHGMPNIIATILILCGVIMIWIRLRVWSLLPGHKVLEEGQIDEPGYPVYPAKCFLLILASFIWVLLLNPLGYWIVSPLYLVFTTWLMGERSWTKIFLFTIIFTLATWIPFGPVLHVRIPLGPFQNWAITMGLSL